MKRFVIIPLTLILLTLLAACGEDSETAPEINQVSYTAADYHFIGPQFLPSGMTELTLINDGHCLVGVWELHLLFPFLTEAKRHDEESDQQERHVDHGRDLERDRSASI